MWVCMRVCLHCLPLWRANQVTRKICPSPKELKGQVGWWGRGLGTSRQLAAAQGHLGSSRVPPMVRGRGHAVKAVVAPSARFLFFRPQTLPQPGLISPSPSGQARPRCKGSLLEEAFPDCHLRHPLLQYPSLIILNSLIHFFVPMFISLDTIVIGSMDSRAKLG